MKLTLILFCTYLVINLSSAQTESFAICLGGQGQQIGSCTNSAAIIVWTSSPYDPNFDTGSQTPTVTPSQSTFYLLTITDFEGNIHMFSYIVYVIEGVTLTVENNLNECMEGRTLSFTANIQMSGELSFSDPVLFKFSYTDASTNSVIQSVMAYSTQASDMWKTKLVNFGDNDNSYLNVVNCDVEINGNVCGSNFLTIDVKRLWINKFEDAETGKDWKVRVNKNISYTSNSSPDCNGWDWLMPEENNNLIVWPLLGQQAGTGTFIIPNSSLPSTNIPFGDDYGNLVVSCFDGELNPHFHNLDYMQNKRLKVFYVATEMNPYNTAVPNWFYYYKSTIPNAGFHYDPNASTSHTFSGTLESSIYIANNAYTGGTTILTTISNDILMATGRSPVHRYYLYFRSVVEHERQHANNELLEMNAIPPYDNDSDYLENAYETSVTRTNPACGFCSHGTESPDTYDGEIYAGGPVEQAGLELFDLIDELYDWAANGVNW